MVKKQNSFILAQLCLCCVILISTQSAEAINFTQLVRTARTAITLIKKIAKVGAILGGAYLIANRLLGHPILHSDREANPLMQANGLTRKLRHLVVYTDGKVTIRKSNDNTPTVTHNFGTSRRSDLPQISHRHYFDKTNGGTLFVQGLLKECRANRFQRFIEWFFHVQPQRTLEHIIEVPETVDVEITTGNSDRYTHNSQEPVVSIDSIKGDITVHDATSGNILTHNTGEQASIKIYTTGSVIATALKGRKINNIYRGGLYVYGTENVQTKRDPQYHMGKVIINDKEQKFNLTPRLFEPDQPANDGSPYKNLSQEYLAKLKAYTPPTPAEGSHV